jgi:hypothetical protein
MNRFLVGTALAAVLLAGCARQPRLHTPDDITSYCPDRYPRISAIESVVSSAGDTAQPPPAPPAAQIAAQLRTSGGLIAHWKAQPLYLPKVAKAFGLDGAYVTLGDAAIVNHSAFAAATESRDVYLTVRVGTATRTAALKAYDVQDVCSEARKKA